MTTTLERRIANLEAGQQDDALCSCSPVSVRLVGTRDGNDGPELCEHCGKPARVTLILEYIRGTSSEEAATA